MLCCAVRAARDERICAPAIYDLSQLKRELLPHQHWKVRLRAAANLINTFHEHHGDAQHVRELLGRTLASDEHWKVRRQAAQSLSELGREAVESTAPILRTAMQSDRDNLVRAAALMALKQHSQAVPACLEYSASETDDEADMCVQWETEIGEVQLPDSFTTSRRTLDELNRVSSKSECFEWVGISSRYDPSAWVEDDFMEVSTNADTIASDRREFVVVLDRGLTDVGIDWGFEVEESDDGTLRIVDIEDGCLESWNSDVEPSKQVEIGDILVKANGRSSVASILQVAMDSSQLELVIQKGRSESTV